MKGRNRSVYFAIKRRLTDVEIASLAARLIVKVTYGYNASGKNDPLLQKLAHAATLFAQLGEAGGSIIDFFPIRK